MDTSERITELLHRNLQEVFGEGDAASPRRAAIDEFYTDDCVLYVPPGALVGRDALDKFAGDLRATHPHFVYTPHGEAQALYNAGILAWGSGPRGEAARLHRDGPHHCPRRKDCCAICFPQSKIVLAVHDTDHRLRLTGKPITKNNSGLVLGPPKIERCFGETSKCR